MASVLNKQFAGGDEKSTQGKTEEIPILPRPQQTRSNEGGYDNPVGVTKEDETYPTDHSNNAKKDQHYGTPREDAASKPTKIATEQERKVVKRQVLRSLILFCVGETLVFQAIFTYTNLVSSLYPIEGLGIVSLDVSAATLIICSWLLSTYFCGIFSARRICTVSLFFGTLYAVCNVSPSWETLVPGNVSLGIAESLNWVAGCAFAFELSQVYAEVTGSDLNKISITFASLFNLACQGSFIAGNLLAYVILDTDSLVGLPTHNATANLTGNIGPECGPKYCNQDLSEVFQLPAKWRLLTLCGVLSGGALLGTVISLGTVDFSKTDFVFSCKRRSFFESVRDVFKEFLNPTALLLLLPTIYVGFEEAFGWTEYTQAYVNCTLGLPKVGLVMMAYGVGQVVASSLQAFLIKWVKSQYLVWAAAALHVSTNLAWQFWKPPSTIHPLYFVLIFMWSCGDAIFVGQLFSIWGYLVKSDFIVGYSVFVGGFAVGYFIALTASFYLCIYMKLYILLAILFVAMIGFQLVSSQMQTADKNETATATRGSS